MESTSKFYEFPNPQLVTQDLGGKKLSCPFNRGLTRCYLPPLLASCVVSWADTQNITQEMGSSSLWTAYQNIRSFLMTAEQDMSQTKFKRDWFHVLTPTLVTIFLLMVICFFDGILHCLYIHKFLNYWRKQYEKYINLTGKFWYDGRETGIRSLNLSAFTIWSHPYQRIPGFH